MDTFVTLDLTHDETYALIAIIGEQPIDSGLTDLLRRLNDAADEAEGFVDAESEEAED